MTIDEQLTATVTHSHRSAACQAAAAEAVEAVGTRPAPSTGGRCGPEPRVPESRLRRPPSRSLVLPQSWVPFSVSRRERASVKRSAQEAAAAFTLLAGEVAARRSEAKPPTA